MSCAICRIKGHSTESCWFNKKNKGKRSRDFEQRGKPKRKRPPRKFASMVATFQESVNAQNKHTAELNSILEQLMKSQVVKAKAQNAPANSQKKGGQIPLLQDSDNDQINNKDPSVRPMSVLNQETDASIRLYVKYNIVLVILAGSCPIRLYSVSKAPRA